MQCSTWPTTTPSTAGSSNTSTANGSWRPPTADEDWCCPCPQGPDRTTFLLWTGQATGVPGRIKVSTQRGVGRAMKPRTIMLGIIVLLLVAGGAAFFYFNNLRSRAADYNPRITPADFTTKITNKYFALPVGKKMTYGTGGDRIEIEILKETRVIEGVETVIYLDQEFKNGQLVEETRDYLAQHTNGDVWYFGEDVNNFKDGQL